MTLERVTLAECEAIFDLSVDGIVVLDRDGLVLYQNAVFSALGPQTQAQILASYQSSLPRVEGFHLHQVPVKAGIALIAHHQQPLQENEKVLSELLLGMRNCNDIYIAAADAVYKALGWRWISVTRFNGPLVEVLAHCCDGRITDNFSFELAGSPCEEMARTKRFTLFSDVAKAFPDNQALQHMGAQTYAGLIYRDNENQPVGHIMGIHDQRDVDYRHCEEVLTLATLALSSHLMLDHANRQLECALEESRTDPLTHLSNRKLFDENTLAAAQRYQRNQVDSCLAVIDVDHFKGYNDRYGHSEGDVLLRLLATELTKLGRETDTAYRVGGDEFAMIFPDADQQVVTRVDRQFHAALKRLSLITCREISGSIGYAMLSDCQDANDWYHQADQHMYRRKAQTKQDNGGNPGS